MKQNIYRIVFGMLIGLTSQVALAQSDQAWMSYMTPGEVHKMIASWDGEWNEEITLWPAPGAPSTKSNVSCINKMILGGRYQESKHTGSIMGMPFEGQSTLAWDNARKVLITTWVDNFGTGLIYMEGTWDEKMKTANFKGTMTDPATGKLAGIREVFKVVDNNTQTMEQFISQDGKEYKSLEIRFTRK